MTNMSKTGWIHFVIFLWTLCQCSAWSNKQRPLMATFCKQMSTIRCNEYPLNIVSSSVRRNKVKNSIFSLRGGNSRMKSSLSEDSESDGNLLFRNAFIDIQNQYIDRLNADPSFLRKSILEVLIAAGTQFIAEWNRRGQSRIVAEIDFVIAGILTAIVGKYYSMWRVAPTISSKPKSNQNEELTLSFWNKVPTNAFQTDREIPLLLRCAAIIAPVPTLFRAGVIASAIGYGITAILIHLRTALLPGYVAQTQNVNIIGACIYTGSFMAVASNIRYQLLQGVIEPIFIDRPFEKFPKTRASLIFMVRYANGLFGSILAISGMRMLGLQKLK